MTVTLSILSMLAHPHPLLAKITDQINGHAVQGFEMVRKIHLDAEQFTVEKNLITPTFKLKRPQLLQHYKANVDAMYGKK